MAMGDIPVTSMKTLSAVDAHFGGRQSFNDGIER
jgi:hypothetical protein